MTTCSMGQEITLPINQETVHGTIDVGVVGSYPKSVIMTESFFFL